MINENMMQGDMMLGEAVNADEAKRERVQADERQRRLNVLAAVWQYDEDEGARALVDGDGRYGVYGANQMRVPSALHVYGKDYAEVAAPELAESPLELCERTIKGMPEERRKGYQEAYNALFTSGKDTKQDWYALYGRMVKDGVLEGVNETKSKMNERKENAGAVFADVVRNGGAVRRYDDGEVSSNQGAAWSKFYEAKARGVYTDEDETSLRRAAAAYEQFTPMIQNYVEAGANVLTQASTGKIIYDLLGDDETARAMFFTAVNEAAKAAASDESQANAFVRLGREFAAAENKMMAAIMGGHFKPYVSDGDVDAYNEWAARPKPRFVLRQPGDPMRQPEDWAYDKIRSTAQEVGQVNEDGTLRKMTDEEKQSKQKFDQFRSQLKQAVDGMYDVDGSFWGNSLGTLGNMAPQSMLFLVPLVGQVGAYKASYTEALAGDLADGRSYDEASARAGASALINTAVERIAFGKVGKMFQPLGLDRLMRTKAMGKMLGGLYGNTAGRLAMGVGVGVLEETFAEPFAGMVLGGVYNAITPSEYELDNPWVGFRNEVSEMCKPENLMATALYGMLLGGVSAHGQHQEAAEYRKTMDALTKAGVNEGRAAQIARMEDPLERNHEAVKEVGFKLSTMDKEQTKNLTEALSDSYPLMAQMATLGHYYESGRLPRLEEAGTDAKGQKQYRVTENGREGEATVMSEEAARKYVQSRMEDMVEEEHARLADKFLADAMVTAAAERGERFVVEEVGETMNADYFGRLATAAQVKLDAGHARDEVVPEVHPELTLGQLAEQSAAWQERLNIARHDIEQKLGRKLTDAEWEERKARLASPVNRTRLRADQTEGRRMRTLLRVARGKYSAMNVLEDVTEDNVVRYMEATGHDLTFFADNLRELGKAMGNEWQFLRELGEGEQHSMLDIVEGLGKVVRGKVLADTAHKANGLPAWVNTFLDMVRRWVEQAAALMKLGEAVNKYLYADEASREKFAPEFREMVEKVAEQDVEFLRELQQERSKEAEARILRAGATGYAPAAEATPTMDAAEAEHGEAVRQEQEAEEAYKERVDEDISAALEMSSSLNTGMEKEKTLQQQKGELHYVRHGDFESATVTRDRRAEDGSVESSVAQGSGEADSERRGDSGAAQGAGRGVQRVHGELRDTGAGGEIQELRRPEARGGYLRLHRLTERVHRFHAEAARKAREKNIYAGELHELQRGAESAALFHDCIEAAKVTQGLQGNCVYTYSEEEYAQMRLFLTPDGKAGLALKNDGDMVSVFKDKTLQDKEERRIDALIALAIQQGAKKADCYGIHLVKLYGKFGFRAVAKDRFNAEYAPEPMQDEGVMREAFNKEPEVGKPDVVYLVYVGDREHVLDEFDALYTPDYAETLDYAQGENTYDACVETQSEAVKQAEKWMRTLPSKEAREAALRKHLQRQSEGHTLSAEEAQKQGLFKDGVMETGNAVITTPDMSSAIEDLQHASPHRFKQFDLEHIGSGEGAQAYGWGVYFSSNWGVNRSYHSNFTRKVRVDGKKVKEYAMNYLSDLNVEEGELLDWDKKTNAFSMLEWSEIRDRLYKKYGEDIWYDGWFNTPNSEYEGYVKALREYYEMRKEVDMEMSTPEEQKVIQEIYDAYTSYMDSRENSFAQFGDDFADCEDGEQFYRKLSQKLGSAKAASEWLLARGIKGIRYVDGATRNSEGEKTHNYVIFDPAVIEIRKVAERKPWSSDTEDSSVWEDYAGWSSSFAAEEMWDEESPLEESVLKEMEDIVAKSKANGTYMKAPNGEDTKLTPEQWAIVRTQAFKGWFGDWEKVATFNSGMEKLEKMKPVASITGNEFAPTGKNDLVQRVVDYWAQHGNVAHNPMLGDVKLDARSVKDSMAHGMGRMKAAAFAAVREVIEGGIFIEYAPDWKGRGKDSYVFAAPVTVNGEDCICEVIVMKDANRTGFYLHEVQVKEKLLDVFKTGLYTGTSGASKSILLQVMGRVKDIEKNCSKIVDEDGEPLVVYHGSGQWFNVFNNGEEIHKSGAPDGSIFASDSRDVATSYFSYWGGKANDVILDPNDARHERLWWGVYRRGGIYNLFMNIKNPLVLDFEGKLWSEAPGGGDINDVVARAKAEGYDGVIAKNIIDIGNADSLDVPASTDYVAFKSEQVKSVDNRGTFDGGNPDITFAMAYIDEEQITRPLKAAARSFRANEAFVQQMLGEMRQCMHKLRELGDRTRTDREEALATMGAVVQLVKSVRLYMPRGYRFSVAPYIRQLERLSELATTGRIHLTQKITERDARELRKMDGEAVNSALETGAYAEGEMADELVREYGDQTLNAVLEKVMSRVADGLRKYAKDEVVKRMAKMLERAQVKKDKKTGKLKGGLMDAEGYREMDKVREAVQMDAGELADKLASLEAKAAKDDLTDAQRDELEGDMALYSTFGDVASMSLEQATEAHEALRGRIMYNKFAWDDKRADIRHARRGVINAVVRELGKAKPNEYHRAKVNKKPTTKAKHLGDIMMSAPQTLRAMAKIPGLGAMVENIATRMNRAGEMMKTWERERWVRLEALSRHCLGKSWRKNMDELHKQQGTGVAYERKIWRTVSIRSDYLKELLRMSPAERAKEMKRNRAAGGVLADAVYSERDIAALAEEMAAQRDGGRVRKTIEARYVEEVQREENLELSKGEALYIILMHEQPTYTERMEAQGYTQEVIAGLREYIGQGWLDFGYGLREMFAEQGDKIAAVYEAVYGVPFPREENYFAARFVVDKVSDNTAEGLLAGMAGQPGVGTGWMKPRVTHNLDVDTNKDALQVFLQAVSLTDAWVATQDVVADLKAYMSDKEFARTVTAKLGKEAYQNFKDWVKILEMGGVNDTVSMGAGQDMIRRVYSAGAISILGWRIQTWFRQFPAIANGILGAHDVSVGEYMGAMSKLKRGAARMTFSRMMASDFMQNRYATDGDKLKEQAMRGDEQSSRMEPWLEAAMAPMGKIDAGLTAAGLVPVWNVYYERAVRQGCSEAEAEARAWEQTELAANMGSQPMGYLNKAKISQVRNPLARGVLFMLSENTNKVGLVSALWKSGHRKAAARAWLIYGGLNAMVSCLLDALQGDPEEFEKGKWWEYVLSALYGPLASMPGVSEIVEGLGTAALNGVGYLVGSEDLQKAKTRASIGRALIDFKGSYKAVKKLYELFSDDDEHSFYEYTRAGSTVSRMLGTGLGWMGNAAGYFSMLTSTLMNPLDFGARVWRNAMHYVGD